MGLVHPIITGSNGDEGYEKKHFTDHLYPHGMVQPAILILQGSTENVLFRWNIFPNKMNKGGASDRPNVTELWEAVKMKLNGEIEEIELSNLSIDHAEQLPLYYVLVSLKSIVKALWRKFSQTPNARD